MKSHFQFVLILLSCLVCLSASLPVGSAKDGKHKETKRKSESKTIDEILDDLGERPIKKVSMTQRETKKQSASATKSTMDSSMYVNNAVIIGDSLYAKRDVTDIGDLDGNGYNDYIVARPHVNKRTGTARIYLMKENRGFVFSRELVPGQWGFKGSSLKSGDLYGSTVFKLPTDAKDSPVEIAIGAPGDSSGKGAVYILNLTQSGTVSKNSKLSPGSEVALARQFDDKEGFGSSVSAIADLNGDGHYELIVKSLSGSSTLLFLDSKRNVRTGLKLGKTATGMLKNIDRIQKSSPVLAEKPVSLFDKSFMSVRTGLSEQCFFNETACACSMMSPEPGSNSCTDVIGTEAGTGRTLCRARDCAPSYQCNCDGTEYCLRTTETRNYNVIEGAAAGGDMYCSGASSEMTVNVVQAGVPIPTPNVIPELDSFNSTHCRCSLKSDVMGSSECLDYVQTFPNGTSLCNARNCIHGSGEYTCDGAGDSYCERNFVQSNYWRDEGDAFSAGFKYCVSDSHTVEQLTRIL